MFLVKPIIHKFPIVKDSRFEEHDRLLRNLAVICHNWAEYLERHIVVTQEIFGTPEFPWQNERVLVSTLTASIMRSNKRAIVSEELPVDKQSSSTYRGRCDLWVHFPAKGKTRAFSFYMEAKKFLREKKVKKLKGLLTGSHGIRRMFSDYAKSRGGRLDQRSAYSRMKNRRHSHYIVGMMCVPLEGGTTNDKDIKEMFEEVFAQRQLIEKDKRRRMDRYPTVAFHLGNPKQSLLVTLTVLGGYKKKGDGIVLSAV